MCEFLSIFLYGSIHPIYEKQVREKVMIVNRGYTPKQDWLVMKDQIILYLAVMGSDV